jgi:hypothetical protein
MYPTVIIPSMNEVLAAKAKSFLPDTWPVIVKDGNPLKHFEELKALPITTKWAINLDEDCFVIDPPAVLRLIAAMEAGGYHTAGIQDGSSYQRAHNPVLFNPFFFVFDVAALQSTPQRGGDIVQISQSYSHLVRFNNLPFVYDEFEAYYPFFVDLLQQGLKPLFLANHAYEAFNDGGYNLGKPSIVLGEDGAELAIHAWYSRLYHSPVVQERIAVCEAYAKERCPTPATSG